VSKSAGPDEIKKAYRKAAIKNHPDKGGDEAKVRPPRADADAVRPSLPAVRSFVPVVVVAGGDRAVGRDDAGVRRAATRRSGVRSIRATDRPTDRSFASFARARRKKLSKIVIEARDRTTD